MSKEKTKVPRPNGICMQCQEAGEFLEHTSGFSVYCPHHASGAVGRVNSDGQFRWLITTPVSHEAWVEMLLQAQQEHGPSAPTSLQ